MPNLIMSNIYFLCFVKSPTSSDQSSWILGMFSEAAFQIDLIEAVKDNAKLTLETCFTCGEKVETKC